MERVAPGKELFSAREGNDDEKSSPKEKFLKLGKTKEVEKTILETIIIVKAITILHQYLCARVFYCCSVNFSYGSTFLAKSM